MNDDLTPPPERPLDDAARARIRERVVTGLDERRPGRWWLVPVAASTPTASGYAALRPDDASAPNGGPAGRGSAEPAPDVPPAPRETPPPDVPEPTSSEMASTSPAPDDPLPDGSPEEDPTTCAREVRGVLPGAEEMGWWADESGSTTFYATGDEYTLCDTHGGRTTVHHPKPLVGEGDRNPYEVSTLWPSGDRAVFAAGGPVPADSPDFAVSYRFGDGHVQRAAIIGKPVDGSAGGYWVMVYAAPDGAAALDRPIEVEVRGGGAPGGELGPLDTCAQANHGC